VVIVSFDVQKLINLMQSRLSILTLISWAKSPVKKIIAYAHIFESFPKVASGLTLRSLIHFEVIFVQGKR
jgi:hypothetical protein